MKIEELPEEMIKTIQVITEVVTNKRSRITISLSDLLTILQEYRGLCEDYSGISEIPYFEVTKELVDTAVLDDKGISFVFNSAPSVITKQEGPKIVDSYMPRRFPF